MVVWTLRTSTMGDAGRVAKIQEMKWIAWQRMSMKPEDGDVDVDEGDSKHS